MPTGTMSVSGCRRGQTRSTSSTKPWPTSSTPEKSTTTSANRSSPRSRRLAYERLTNLTPTPNRRTTVRVLEKR